MEPKTKPNTVSKKLIGRLPRYLDYLKSLPEDDPVNISATRMANDLGLGDVLVRKDLAKVSSGGRRKTGYLRENLIRDLEAFLDFDSTTYAILVGTGKLGQALLDYRGFDAFGLSILAGFDTSPETKRSDVGKPIYPVGDLEEYCRTHSVSVGIITVPAHHAQTVCDRLVACSVEAIWNFAPVHLSVPENVLVQTENLALSLTALRMELRNREQN